MHIPVECEVPVPRGTKYIYISRWHQEAIAWTVGKAGEVVTWTANDYARDLVLEMRSWIMNVSVDINADKRGG